MGNTKYKILLVDDDKFILDMYTLKFKEGGFEVVAVSGAQDALDTLADQDNFDIVLFDLIMPVMDGFMLVEKIREKKLANKSALIVLSNQGQRSDIERVEKFDVDGYIIKANTIPSEVLTKVEKIVKEKK